MPPGVLALACIAGFFLLASMPIIFKRRSQLEQMAEACAELARRTGMEAITPKAWLPGILVNLGSWTRQPAAATGSYRDRKTTVSMTGSGGGWTSEYAESSPYEYTVVTMDVLNNAGFSLKIQVKNILSRLFARSAVLTSMREFDERIVITGKPQYFVERMAAWIPSLASPPLAWIINEKPKISLDVSGIKCEHSLVKDPDKQIAILNLLCDMAEQVERSGSTSMTVGLE